MAEPIEELRKARLAKLNKLITAGKLGYPSWSGNRNPISTIKDEGKFDLAGRIMAIRGHGKLIFADLVDESGKIQLSFGISELEKSWPEIELLDVGDFVLVSGEIYHTKAGEKTVRVNRFNLITKSIRPLPSTWYGFSDVEERYRQRYVDLIVNDDVKNIFLTRTKIVSLFRKHLDSEGFVEVETPILQPLYGGATAKPFITHHNALDVDFYLRVSDELYLKRLIVGGFEKVYEIGHDFRNEGMDRNHNPEFTMLEFYWAYANYEDLMKFTEKMISSIIKEIKGTYKVDFQGEIYDFTPSWQRITLRDLILKDSGIDIDKDNTEEKLRKAIEAKKIKLNLSGIVGFGPLVDQLYKEVSRPNIKGPLFLIDYPSEMLPLAKRKAEDPKKVGSFQLLVNGGEWIKAYDELNDPLDQKARWEAEMKLAEKGLAEYQVLDEDYIRALEYGMPPTAGWGMGIEKLIGMLTNVSHPYKEAILFPALRPEKDSSKQTIVQDFDHKMVIVIDSKLPEWQIMNTSAHVSAFLGNKMKAEFDTGKYFVTRDGVELPRNSQYPIVTLSADKKEIKDLIDKLRKTNLLYIGYVPEMMKTTNDKELEKILGSKEEKDVEYVGVGLFGNKEEVDRLTKELSLWGK